VIDRRVIVVALVDRKLQQVLWQRGDRGIVHWDSCFHRESSE
jgi:hypothetical protein